MTAALALMWFVGVPSLAYLIARIAIAAKGPKRNRRWPTAGQCHSSYWSSAKRIAE